MARFADARNHDATRASQEQFNGVGEFLSIFLREIFLERQNGLSFNGQSFSSQINGSLILCRSLMSHS
jgi:hypothetical protein